VNNIIIVYPQAIPINITNTNGCWDIWGYTDDYYGKEQRGSNNLPVFVIFDHFVVVMRRPTCRMQCAVTVRPYMLA